MSESVGAGPATAASGRTANGGGRTASTSASGAQYPAVRGPRDIMRDRQAREARRKAESEARERELQDAERLAQEERRRSAERRVATAGVTGGAVGGGEGQGYRRPSAGNQAARPVADSGVGVPDVGRRPGDRAVSGPAAINTTTAEAQPTATTRPRGSSLQGQARTGPSQPTMTATAPHRPQEAQSQPAQSRPTAASASQTQGANVPPPASQRAQATTSTSNGTAQQRTPTVSSFPHAFERWEQLSSHWEGLTSYWIRRLESNSDEVRREPLAQQMSRQITDLSAAGANLFHAVVELQRLRASSERKFTRWLLEQKGEQERAKEIQAELETGLRNEQQARIDAIHRAVRMEKEKSFAEKMVSEMRRELQISKEEARRAWEELGRREQEERDRTASLREGQPTVVGGVQVVPMAGAPSRHASTSRSQATEAVYPGVPSFTAASGPGVVGSEAAYGTYDPDAQSITDTDPYADRGPEVYRPLPHELDVAALSGSGATTPTTRVAYQPGHTGAPQTASVPATSQEAIESYPAYHSPSREPPSAPVYQQPATDPQEHTAEDLTHHAPSVGDTLSEEEYELDDKGQVLYNTHGEPVIAHGGARSEGSEEFEHRQQRAIAAQQHGPGFVPVTSSGDYGYGGDPVDYSGAGYGWEASVPRHHHPTRLSDVIEEDERSRTSPSRASQASRGFY